MNATCALCSAPIDFGNRPSYIYSRFTLAHFCADFQACDERRGVPKKREKPERIIHKRNVVGA